MGEKTQTVGVEYMMLSGFTLLMSIQMYGKSEFATTRQISTPSTQFWIRLDPPDELPTVCVKEQPPS